MVARQFLVRHNDAELPVEYETQDGLEVLKFQIFSLTSIPPDQQKILVEEENLVLTETSDLETISDRLRLLSVQEDPRAPEEEEAKSVPAETPNQLSDEDFARILQAEEDALYFQQFHAGEGRREFEQRVRPYISQVLMYEDPVRQEAARKSVPLDEIEEKALVSLAKEGNFNPSKNEKDHAFLLQLLFWFKRSFRWVNSPPCDGCSSVTSSIGMGSALPSEVQFGGSRVELYGCQNCSRITRFPRYNDPLKLLETRSGRCGEWANCFTLYCRAFGYESRLIIDFTDHVWTECFSDFLGRWMHLDPCEGLYDKPLLYEKGWSKKLSYVIALAKDGVHDVTKRYTRKWHEVLSRRNITTEAVLTAVLSDITKECRIGYSSHSLQLLECRDRREAEELETNVHMQYDANLLLPGRQSGSKEWRIARSEVRSDEDNSFGSSSCPFRICVDDHVRNIYSSLSLILSYFVDNGHSKSETIKILEILRRLLLHLRTKSFRVRKVSIKSNSNDSKLFKEDIPVVNGLLSAISLRRELETDGRVCISLAGDPVPTSVALPVALDALDEVIDNIHNSNYVGKDLCISFLKYNRIPAGSVLASGEELPFGIATSAFDGIRISKWEEPNGARGCWLIYKVMNSQMFDLEAYDLMSANDAPERDPMDWIVEGSEDGGSSWNILDKQTSQVFEKRLQRKMFKVDSRQMSNAFRLRFIQVRDPKATSRFQLGSIDLYGKGSPSSSA